MIELHRSAVWRSRGAAGAGRPGRVLPTAGRPAGPAAIRRSGGGAGRADRAGRVRPERCDRRRRRDRRRCAAGCVRLDRQPTGGRRAGTAPGALRRRRPGRGRRALRAVRARGGRAAQRSRIHRAVLRILARLRLPDRPRRAAATAPAGHPATRCRPVRWPSPTSTPASTRAARPAAGGCSAGPRRSCSTWTASRRRCWRPGTAVRFVPAMIGRPVIEIATGPLATVQDLGRPGYRRPRRQPVRGRRPGAPTSWPTGWSATRSRRPASSSPWAAWRSGC